MGLPSFLGPTVGDLVLQADTYGIPLLFILQGGGVLESRIMVEQWELGGARVLLPRFRITAECEFVRLCALVISGWHLMLTQGYVTYQMIPAHHQTVSYTHAGRMAGRFFMHNLQENTDME